MKTYKTKINPFSKKLERIFDVDLTSKSDIDHKHSLSDINGLVYILNALQNNSYINISGGYFIN
jgi:hypothetical protein